MAAAATTDVTASIPTDNVCFAPSEWVCLMKLSTDPPSQKQLGVLQNIDWGGPNAPKPDALDCEDPHNANVQLCNEIPTFPALCHKSLKQCVYGVHASLAEMESTCGAVVEAAVGRDSELASDSAPGPSDDTTTATASTPPAFPA